MFNPWLYKIWLSFDNLKWGMVTGHKDMHKSGSERIFSSLGIGKGLVLLDLLVNLEKIYIFKYHIICYFQKAAKNKLLKLFNIFLKHQNHFKNYSAMK